MDMLREVYPQGSIAAGPDFLMLLSAVLVVPILDIGQGCI